MYSNVKHSSRVSFDKNLSGTQTVSDSFKQKKCSIREQSVSLLSLMMSHESILNFRKTQSMTSSDPLHKVVRVKSKNKCIFALRSFRND